MCVCNECSSNVPMHAAFVLFDLKKDSRDLEACTETRAASVQLVRRVFKAHKAKPAHQACRDDPVLMETLVPPVTSVLQDPAERSDPKVGGDGVYSLICT